jgi:hypothetical protein
MIEDDAKSFHKGTNIINELDTILTSSYTAGSFMRANWKLGKKLEKYKDNQVIKDLLIKYKLSVLTDYYNNFLEKYDDDINEALGLANNVLSVLGDTLSKEKLEQASQMLNKYLDENKDDIIIHDILLRFKLNNIAGLLKKFSTTR